MRHIKPAPSQRHNSNLARRFLGGATWSVLGAVFTSGINLLALMFVARYLGKESYGQFTVVQSTLSSIGIFAGFGVGAASIKFIAELRSAGQLRLGKVLALSEGVVVLFGVLGSFLVFLNSDLIASKALNSPTLSVPLSVAALAILLTTLDGYQKSVMIGFEAMKKFFIASISGVFLGVPVMLILSSRYLLEGACWALVISAFIQCLISRFMMNDLLKNNGVEFNRSDCFSEKAVIWKFSLPAMLASAMVVPSHWVVNTFLAKSPGGYAELAVLGIAMQWFNVIMFVPGTAGRVVLPILTDHVAKSDHANSKKILLYAMAANGIVAVPVALLVSVFSQSIISMYGSGYENENNAIVIAVFTAVLVAVLAPVGNLLAAASKMWLGFFMNAAWATIYLSGAYFFSEYGAVGALTSLAFAYVCHSAWTVLYAVTCSKLKV